MQLTALQEATIQLEATRRTLADLQEEMRQGIVEKVAQRLVEDPRFNWKAGIFKGEHGLRGLAECDAFWEHQHYSTRLYYGDGVADYLHRDVLRAAVRALDGSNAAVHARAERAARGPSAGSAGWA